MPAFVSTWKNRSITACAPRRGIALIVVVIVIALVTTSALTFALLMQQSNQTSRHFADQQQSQWAMDSAIAQLESLAALPPQQRDARTSSPSPAGFVRSIEIQPVSEESGDIASLGTDDGDWISSETGEDTTPEIDWENSLDDQDVTFDPTQPGFLVFDWTTGPTGQPSGTSPAASMLVPSGSGNVDVAVRFGWTNESHKLHLARLLQWEASGTPVSDLLQVMYGLSPEQAERLLDWLDSDDQARAFGAEANFYSQRGLRYRPANQVPQTLDALLLVPGFSPRLLYGHRQTTTIRIDAAATESNADDLADFSSSQQTQIDRDLQSLPGSAGAALDRDLLLELGLTSRLTVTAKERHQNQAGQLKLPINHPDLQQLFAAVSARVDPNLAAYLCLARQLGVHDDIANPPGDDSRELAVDEVELDFSQPPTNTVASLIHLIDSHVRVRQTDGSFAVVRSPLRASELQDEFASRVSEVFAELTHAQQPVTDSRLHWRQPDPRLWLWIPGLTPETQTLLLESDLANSERTEEGHTGSLAFQVATWYREGRVDASQWQIIERELTDGGDVFSAYVGAHAGDYQAFRWGHVIVDASEKRPQQVYYRELLPPPPTLQAVMATLNETALANP